MSGDLYEGGITDVAGIEVGHYTDAAGATGCTVVLCRDGAVAGVDVRGGSPGTRETDALRPGSLVERVHAVLLSGGSAFGLDAATGVSRYLEERGLGFRVGPAIVPVVPAAILFDLGLGSDRARPGADEGYRACIACSSGPVQEGSVGAGTGATVAKSLGMSRAVKGGLGTSAITLSDGSVVAAAVAVNSYGGIVDHRSGCVLAGPRRADGEGFHDPVDVLVRGEETVDASATGSTAIGVVATDATLTKEEAYHLARVAHDGLALTVRPCHTLRDGDTLFALATGRGTSAPDMVRIGVAAVEVVARSVLRAVQRATGLVGIPSIGELGRE